MESWNRANVINCVLQLINRMGSASKAFMAYVPEEERIVLQLTGNNGRSCDPQLQRESTRLPGFPHQQIRQLRCSAERVLPAKKGWQN